MKTKYLFGALALATLGLTSCSNDEPINPGGGTTGEGGDQYVAVRIHSVGTTGGRAEAGEGFEEGLGNENKITLNDTRFYFFDANGNPFPLATAGVNGTIVKTNMVRPIQLQTGTDTSDGGECTIKGVLVLGKAEGDGYLGASTPSRMVCLVNLPKIAGVPDKDPYEEFAGISLGDFKGKLSITASSQTDLATKFAMSNSTYMVGTTETYWTDLTDCVYTLAADAENNPAHVYIERLVSKVRVSGLGDYPSLDKDGEEAEYDIYDPTTGGTVKTKLCVSLEGWRLRNIFKQVKIIKSLAGTIPNFTYNFPELHRSYWAITGNEQGKIEQHSYNIYSENGFSTHDYANAVSDDDKLAASFYIYPSTTWYDQPNYENTIPQANIETNFAVTPNGAKAFDKNPVSNRVANCTAVVVKARVYFVDEDGNKTEAAELINWNGSYFKLNDFKEYVANFYNSVPESGKLITAANVFINTTDEKGTTSGHNNMRTVYIGETQATATTPVPNLGKVYYWQNGLTSFYVNIQHAKDVNDRAIFGIVRNHIYDITFTGVKGLGVPGNDIENPKDPEANFLAAHIDVLNWKVVKNTIVLE